MHLYGEPLSNLFGRLQEQLGVERGALADALGLSVPMIAALAGGDRTKVASPPALGRLHALRALAVAAHGGALDRDEVLAHIAAIQASGPLECLPGSALPVPHLLGRVYALLYEFQALTGRHLDPVAVPPAVVRGERAGSAEGRLALDLCTEIERLLNAARGYERVLRMRGAALDHSGGGETSETRGGPSTPAQGLPAPSGRTLCPTAWLQPPDGRSDA